MTDDVANIILERIRRMDDKLDTVVAELRELRLRATAMEVQVAATNQHLDRLDARIAKIERQLDLVEG